MAKLQDALGLELSGEIYEGGNPSTATNLVSFV